MFIPATTRNHCKQTQPLWLYHNIKRLSITLTTPPCRPQQKTLSTKAISVFHASGGRFGKLRTSCHPSGLSLGGILGKEATRWKRKIAFQHPFQPSFFRRHASFQGGCFVPFPKNVSTFHLQVIYPHIVHAASWHENRRFDSTLMFNQQSKNLHIIVMQRRDAKCDGKPKTTSS